MSGMCWSLEANVSTGECPLEVASKICYTVVCSFSSLNHGHNLLLSLFLFLSFFLFLFLFFLFFFFFSHWKNISSSASTSVSCLSYTQRKLIASYSGTSKKCAQKCNPKKRLHNKSERCVSESVRWASLSHKRLQGFDKPYRYMEAFLHNYISIDEKGNR